MSEYKKPYLYLFNQVSQLIEDLQRVQLRSEELIMDAVPDEAIVKKEENCDEDNATGGNAW